jgi:hypothetical protein
VQLQGLTKSLFLRKTSFDIPPIDLSLNFKKQQEITAILSGLFTTTSRYSVLHFMLSTAVSSRNRFPKITLIKEVLIYLLANYTLII